MKAPCADCPFLKNHESFLHPGRLDQIKTDLLDNDHEPFFCHKTVDYSRGMDDDGVYSTQGSESYCAGSMTFLHVNQRWNVPMRLGYAFRMFNPESLDRFIPAINTDLPPAERNHDEVLWEAEPSSANASADILLQTPLRVGDDD